MQSAVGGFDEQGGTRVRGEVLLRRIAADNPRTTPLIEKRAIYGWTLASLLAELGPSSLPVSLVSVSAKGRLPLPFLPCGMVLDEILQPGSLPICQNTKFHTSPPPGFGTEGNDVGHVIVPHSLYRQSAQIEWMVSQENIQFR